MGKTVDIAGKKYPADTWDLDLGDIKRTLTTLPDLSGLPKLRELTIRDHDLKSLDGIEVAKRLWKVSIESRVKDLSALAKLPKLEILDLTGAPRKNFADVPTMPKLRSLIANRVGLRSLAGLERFRGLEILNIDDNAVKKLEGLAKLRAFHYLSCERNALRELRGLPTSMKTVYAGDNSITSFAGVEKLAKLEVLDLDYNKLTKLPRLSSPKLEILRMSSNMIPRLENIERLRSLRILELEGDYVLSVSPETAAWLRSRKGSFQFHASGRALRTKPQRFLAKQTIE